MQLKKLLPLIIFVLFVNAYPTVHDQEMIRGNEFYRQGNFTKAVESYEAVLASGYESSSLYYNLGNAYYRTGKLGYAILYFEKALKLSPGDEDIYHNLSLANTKIPDRIDTLPAFFLFRWWESLLALFSLNGWTYTAFLLYFILLCVIAAYVLVKNPKMQRMLFFGGIGVLFLLIFSAAVLSVNYNRELNQQKGVITESIVLVKNAPDEKANDAFVIHEGLKVSLEDRVAGWFKIKLNDGKVGWINRSTVRII